MLDIGVPFSISPKINPDEDFIASGVNGCYLGTGNLASFTYWSKDGSSFDLSDNESNEDPVDNFTVGYNTTLDCSN